MILSVESEHSVKGWDGVDKALLISLRALHVTCSKHETDRHSVNVRQDSRRSSARVKAMILLVVDVLDEVAHKLGADLFGSEWG